MAALSASRCNPVLALFYQTLKKRPRTEQSGPDGGDAKTGSSIDSELKKLAAKPVKGKVEKT